MKFRLALGASNANGGQQGFARGFDTLASLPMLQAQAAEEGQNAEMKRSLMRSQQSEADAHAALFGQQADAGRQQLARGGMGELLKSAALQQGVPLSQLGEATDYLQSGQLAGKYDLPGGQAGPTLPTPQYADPQVSAKIYKALGMTQQALAVGDKSVENIAKASGEYQKQDAVREVVSNPAMAALYGQGYAAVGGKPLVNNIGNTGETFNQFTGAGDVASPGLRALYGDVQGANIQRDKAGAAASYANAGAARALADQRRAVTAAGPSGGGGAPGGKAPSGYRYATGPDGEVRLEAIPGGPKDPSNKPALPLPASAAKGYLDNLQNLRRAERALALTSGETVDGIHGDPEATGWKGIVPGAILNRVDPEGVNTRAAIADLGSLVIHDRSGAAVTASEMPRLAPFIPNPTDDAGTVKKKLQQFVANYRSVIDDAGNFYRSSGYAVPGIPGHAAPAGGGGAPAPGTVENGYRFKGGNPADPHAWEQVK